LEPADQAFAAVALAGGGVPPPLARRKASPRQPCSSLQAHPDDDLKVELGGEKD